MIKVKTFVMCDRCYRAHVGVTMDRLSVKFAKLGAESNGWMILPAKRGKPVIIFCPKCANAYLNSKARPQ